MTMELNTGLLSSSFDWDASEWSFRLCRQRREDSTEDRKAEAASVVNI